MINVLALCPGSVVPNSSHWQLYPGMTLLGVDMGEAETYLIHSMRTDHAIELQQQVPLQESSKQCRDVCLIYNTHLTGRRTGRWSHLLPTTVFDLQGDANQPGGRYIAGHSHLMLHICLSFWYVMPMSTGLSHHHD